MFTFRPHNLLTPNRVLVIPFRRRPPPARTDTTCRKTPLAPSRRPDHHGGDGMRNLARILCAIDLEKASEPAFDRALRLAMIGDATLFLLHATPANVRFSSRARERLEYLTDLRKRAEAAGVK